MELKHWLIKPQHTKRTTLVIVTLHGRGSNYFDLPPLLNTLKDDVVQVNIQGNIRYGNGFAFYDANFALEPEEDVLASAGRKLHEYIHTILATNGLLDNPVFTLGFSQGAIMSTVLLTLFKDDYRGAIILSGRLPEFLQRFTYTYPHQIFISQGQFDPLFDLSKGQAINTYFLARGAQTSYHVYEVGHGVSLDGQNDVISFIKRFIS